MELFILRETGVEDNAHTGFCAVIDEAQKRSFDLLIRQGLEIEKERPCRPFKGIAGDMPVFADKIA